VAEEILIEASVSILMQTMVVDTITDGANMLAGLIVESKAGRQAILAKMIIDCTGDADVAAMAGVPYRLGHKGETQYPSHNFRMQNVDVRVARQTSIPALRQKMKEIAVNGEFDLPRTDGVFLPTGRPGEVLCNMTRVSRDGASLNGTKVDDLTYGEIVGKKQAQQYALFLKKYIGGFENSFLDDTGQIGIRQSRMIDGEYVLTNEDVLSGAKFKDAIAKNAWCIELHQGDGVQVVWLKAGDYYEIPYRCLVPKRIDNLLVAGRCISTEHEAQASARVTAQCFSEGQAAGTAAAIGLKKETTPRQMDPELLRRVLDEQGASLSSAI